MKQRLIYTLILLFAACHANSQTTVTGTVTDGREPLTGANVYIIGTIDGCLTDSLGRFSFQTDRTGEVTLQVTYLGFDDYSLTTSQLTNLTIKMHERATSIDEVVVTASTYSFGKSDNFKTMDALDVVMSGNSCGDIVAALQTLPGTQKVGEDGKLYVRGGESDECQTFVNGMHVLVPYSTNTENNASRGRFSPFLFKGINFSLGGYGGEYGQALSSVLPMETTDAELTERWEDADIILLCLPGYAIRETLLQVKDYLRPETAVGSVVSSTGFFFEAMKLLPSSQPLFGFQRVPFISRVIEYGQRARLMGYKDSLNMAIERAEHPEQLRDTLADMLQTPIQLLGSYYEASLSNSNPLLHPSRLYSLWKNWHEGEIYTRVPFFYEEWTEETAQLYIQMDNELQALLELLPVRKGSIATVLDYYESTDAVSLALKLRSIEAFKGILSPMKQVEGGYVLLP